MTADELRGLSSKLRESEACQRHDLVDPIVMFIATGLRISELLGLRWVDVLLDRGHVEVTGKVIRAASKGLLRIDETKTAAGRRTLPLPTFAVTVCRLAANFPISASSPWCSPPRRARGATRTTSAHAGGKCARSWVWPTRQAIHSARPWPR